MIPIGDMSTTKVISMDFAPPDTVRFPCLRHAYGALRAGGTATTAFNASNEVAVAEFIKGNIRWVDIASVVGETLSAFNPIEPTSLDDILESDSLARVRAAEIIKNKFLR